jgi:hypothetical protein
VPLYVIPRVRAGPSYKDIPLFDWSREKMDCTFVQYACISKGFPMQNLSSFTLGPVIGEGFCIVNSAFCKSICVMHIEGGGKVNLKRKNFWQKARNPARKVEIIDDNYMNVDNIPYNIYEWLEENKKLWFDQWLNWSRSIALCSQGDFHWSDGSSGSPTVTYYHQNKYLNFVTWKKECYIKPAYNLLSMCSTFGFLWDIYKNHRIPLGLVHPKGLKLEGETPLSPIDIQALYNNTSEMCCMPYVVAGFLLGVAVD